MKNYPEIIEFPEQTVVIAKNQPEYRPLPAFRYPNDEKGRICFCWKIDFLDRIKILFTGKIWHEVLTFNQPLQPQLLIVDKPTFSKESCGDN